MPSRTWCATATRSRWRASPTSSRSPRGTRSSASARRDLTLVRMTPDIVYDQLIGAGCAREADLLLGRQPGRRLAAPLPRRARAGWPRPLEIEEHSHAGMANRYVAGASGLPFAVLRGYDGTDRSPEHTDTIKTDHLPVHRRAADRRAGAQPGRHDHPRAARRPRRATSSCGASPACRRRPCSAPSASLVTVEEIVDELDARSRRGRAAALGGRRASRGARRREPRPTRRATTTATTTRTGRGTRSAGTGERFDGMARTSCGGRPHDLVGDEMMSVAAARRCATRPACFVGIGLPCTGANLARRLHAPELVLIYESGTIGAKPDALPLSIGDGMLAETAATVGRLGARDLQLLAAARPDRRRVPRRGAQIDRFGNINTTVIGDYDEPEVRLPGRRRRAGDRRVVPRGDRGDAPVAAGVRRAGRLRDLRRARHGPGDRDRARPARRRADRR